MKIHAVCQIALFMLFVSCKDTERKTVSSEPASVNAEKNTTQKPTYEDLDGNPVELSDYKGKMVLLNYWATWCRPCLEEMPALLKAQETLADSYVFLLASDQSITKIKAFAEKKDYAFTYVKFNGALAARGINALPTTFVYNTQGDQVDKIVGMTVWDGPEMIQRLMDLVN